jgi:hypothetical protein
MEDSTIVIEEKHKTMVGVAQLVEPRLVMPVVVGSSPIVHPKFSRDLRQIAVGR